MTHTVYNYDTEVNTKLSNIRCVMKGHSSLIETLSTFLCSITRLMYEKSDGGVIYITDVCYKDSLIRCASQHKGLKQYPRLKLAFY